MLTRRAALAVTALVSGLAVGVAEAAADIDEGFGSGGRHVVETDVTASNGVIHVIDSVLLPE